MGVPEGALGAGVPGDQLGDLSGAASEGEGPRGRCGLGGKGRWGRCCVRGEEPRDKGNGQGGAISSKPSLALNLPPRTRVQSQTMHSAAYVFLL